MRGVARNLNTMINFTICHCGMRGLKGVWFEAGSVPGSWAVGFKRGWGDAASGDSKSACCAMQSYMYIQYSYLRMASYTPWSFWYCRVFSSSFSEASLYFVLSDSISFFKPTACDLKAGRRTSSQGQHTIQDVPTIT